MAKGDSGRAQNQINTQGQLAQNQINNQDRNVNNYLSSTTDKYNNAYNQDQQMYSNLGQGYTNFLNSISGMYAPSMAGYQSMYGGAGSLANNSSVMNPLNSAISGYQNFADTGGFSPQDLADMRARAVAPVRSIYANAQAGIDRQRSLQNGYSPNYTAATAKMAREGSAGAADALTNANAGIAGQVQQGKLQGLQGLGNSAQLEASIAQIDNQLKQAGLAGMTDVEKSQLASELGGYQGLSNLYSATPGMSNMYGQQLQTANQQGLDLAQLQNQLGLGLISNQINASQIPGDFQQGLGNTAGILGLIGKGAGFMKNLFGGGGKGKGYGGGGSDDSTFDPRTGGSWINFTSPESGLQGKVV